MYDDLSSRQIAILEYIKKEIRTKGYPPAVREIGEAVGLSSSSTVHGHLAQLEEKGYIRRDPTKPRAIEVIDGNANVVKKEIINVPIVGKVTAGENLWNIATKYTPNGNDVRETVDKIKDFNNLDVSSLSVGQELKVPYGI